MEDKNWFSKTFNNNRRMNKKRLFLFPFAGGGASVFRSWQSEFKDVELFCAQYPGRENRISEKPVNNFEELFRNIYESIIPLIDEGFPYYFFGHSLGTKIIYELTLSIQKNCLFMPEGIIVSAGKAPCFKEKKPIYQLNDADFIKELRRFSGTPEEILSNRDLMNIFLPILRADFTIDETYHNEEIEKLNCPILGLMGTKDTELTLDELLKWSDYTNKSFRYEFVKGGHMFINTKYKEVIKWIKEFIENDRNN